MGKQSMEELIIFHEVLNNHAKIGDILIIKASITMNHSV